jgi:hypothetical protein
MNLPLDLKAVQYQSLLTARMRRPQVPTEGLQDSTVAATPLVTERRIIGEEDVVSNPSALPDGWESSPPTRGQIVESCEDDIIEVYDFGTAKRPSNTNRRRGTQVLTEIPQDPAVATTPSATRYNTIEEGDIILNASAISDGRKRSSSQPTQDQIAGSHGDDIIVIIRFSHRQTSIQYE